MDDPLIYVRAVHFAATILVTGVAFFLVFVAEPAFRRAGAVTDVPSVVRNKLRWIVFCGLLLTLLSGVAWLVLVTQSVSDQSLAIVFSEGIVWTMLTETGFGRDWLERLVLGCLLGGFFVPLLAAQAAKSSWIKALVVASAAGLIGLLAWAGHAAGGSGIEGVLHPAADILHLIAAAAWVGGLLPLALLLWAAGRDPGSVAIAQTATLRFSTLGIVCVATLIITGTINTWYLAGSIPALIETDYGHLLLIKIALFLGMVATATVNRLRLVPRVAQDGGSATQDALRLLRRNVAIEIAAAVAVIAVVAVLGVTPPGQMEALMPHAHHHSH